MKPQCGLCRKGAPRQGVSTDLPPWLSAAKAERERPVTRRAPKLASQLPEGRAVFPKQNPAEHPR